MGRGYTQSNFFLSLEHFKINLEFLTLLKILLHTIITLSDIFKKLLKDPNVIYLLLLDITRELLKYSQIAKRPSSQAARQPARAFWEQIC